MECSVSIGNVATVQHGGAATVPPSSRLRSATRPDLAPWKPTTYDRHRRHQGDLSGVTAGTSISSSSSTPCSQQIPLTREISARICICRNGSNIGEPGTMPAWTISAASCSTKTEKLPGGASVQTARRTRRCAVTTSSGSSATVSISCSNDLNLSICHGAACYAGEVDPAM